MSYENPLRIIDTQSGQAFRDMQKSIADTTISYQKGFENEFVRRRKLNAEIVKDVDIKKTLAMQAGMDATKDNPLMDATAGIQEQVKLYGEAMLIRPSDRTEDQKNLVKNVPLIGTITRNMVTNTGLAGEDFTKKYNLGLGVEGGIYTGTKNYKAGLIMFGMGQIPGRREIKYETRNGTLTALTYLYDEKGNPLKNDDKPPTEYGGIANSDINNLFGVQGIPNETPKLQDQTKLGIKASDFKNMDADIYKDSPILRNNVPGGVRYYKKPNVEYWRDKIATPLAKSRIKAMGAEKAMIYANDVLKIQPPFDKIVAGFNTGSDLEAFDIEKRLEKAYIDRMQELTPELGNNQAFGSFDKAAYDAQQAALSKNKGNEKITGSQIYTNLNEDILNSSITYLGAMQPGEKTVDAEGNVSESIGPAFDEATGRLTYYENVDEIKTDDKTKEKTTIQKAPKKVEVDLYNVKQAKDFYLNMAESAGMFSDGKAGSNAKIEFANTQHQDAIRRSTNASKIRFEKKFPNDAAGTIKDGKVVYSEKVKTAIGEMRKKHKKLSFQNALQYENMLRGYAYRKLLNK